MKLVWRVLETVLRNQKNLICKNRLKHLKRKCFSVLRQKQSCSHRVKNGSKNLQRFSFKLSKPFCLSSEQGLRSREQLFLDRPLCSCFLHNDYLPYFQLLLLKTFLWDVISFTIFHLSHIFCYWRSLIYLISTEKWNKWGNTLMEFKYLLFSSIIDLFDVKDFKRNLTDGNLIRKCV